MQAKKGYKRRLREASERQKKAAEMNHQLSRLMLAVLTEAEGRIEVSREALDKPAYSAVRVNVHEGHIEILGVKPEKAP